MNDTEKLYVYVDNWFKLYINGKLAAVDSIEFMPHNIVSVDVASPLQVDRLVS
jgi:hypothetical protein